MLFDLLSYLNKNVDNHFVYVFRVSANTQATLNE